MSETGEQLSLRNVKVHRYCDWCHEPLPEWYHGNRRTHIGDCEQRAEEANRERKAEERRYEVEQARLDREKHMRSGWKKLSIEHPEIKRYFIEKIQGFIYEGCVRIESKLVWALLRRDLKISVNNNFTRFCLDDVLEDHPEFKRYFTRRSSAGVKL